MFTYETVEIIPKACELSDLNSKTEQNPFKIYYYKFFDLNERKSLETFLKF